MRGASAPVELLHPDSLLPNADEIRSALRRHGLRDDLVYFACKANRHPSFIFAAKRAGIGVDVTSAKDLENALGAGLNPGQILITSAVKADSFLELAANNGVITVIDNFDELAICQSQLSRPPIFVRLGGWQVNGTRTSTRFGFYPEQIGKVAELCKAAGFDIRGVQFHLKSYSFGERTAGVEHALGVIKFLRDAGFNPGIIDIGGGIPVSYLSSKSEWEEFNMELKASVLDGEEITFARDGLGYLNVNGTLHGSPTFYPYWNDLIKERYLSELLSMSLSNGHSIAKNLKQQNVSLQIEPGRALLDQCGCLLVKVAFTKTDSHGRYLTGLFMNRTQLMSSSSDFCLDPITFSDRPIRATYLVGSYCIESDVIMKRKLMLPELLRNDLLLIPNTAAYVTSLFSSNSHGLGEVERIVVNELGGLP